MAHDWSATRQAEMNVARKGTDEVLRERIRIVERNIAGVVMSLDTLNQITIDNNDPDFLAALRSIGAMYARLNREHVELQRKAEILPER